MSFTPLQLRQIINDALGDEIGTYQYGDLLVSALRVEGIGEFLDGEGNEPSKPDFVNGLEVVIRPSTLQQINGLLGVDYFVVETAEVVLKQHDITKTTLEAAAILRPAIARWLNTQSVTRVLRSAVLDSIETQAFTLSFFTN